MVKCPQCLSGNIKKGVCQSCGYTDTEDTDATLGAALIDIALDAAVDAAFDSLTDTSSAPDTPADFGGGGGFDGGGGGSDW